MVPCLPLYRDNYVHFIYLKIGNSISMLTWGEIKQICNLRDKFCWKEGQ